MHQLCEKDFTSVQGGYAIALIAFTLIVGAEPMYEAVNDVIDGYNDHRND